MQGKVGDNVRGLCHGHKSRKSATQIMKVGDVICVADFHDLCPQQVRDFVGNFSQTLSQSRRNGIWASQDTDLQSSLLLRPFLLPFLFLSEERRNFFHLLSSSATSDTCLLMLMFNLLVCPESYWRLNQACHNYTFRKCWRTNSKANAENVGSRWLHEIHILVEIFTTITVWQTVTLLLQ